MTMKIDDPGTALEVMGCLADKSRQRILRHLIDKAETGMTASELAEVLGKKIPTILYHLETLKETGIVEPRMKLLGRVGREVKHWFVTSAKIELTLDLEILSRERQELEVQSTSLLNKCIREEGGIISMDLRETISVEEVEKCLGVSRILAKEILDILTPQTIEKIITEEVERAFRDARQNRVIMELSRADIEKNHLIDETLASRVVSLLMQSGKYDYGLGDRIHLR